MPDSSFTITTDRDPRGTVVRLVGEADATDVTPLKARLRDLAESRPNRVVIDLSKLTYAGSLVLGALFVFNGQMVEQGGKVHLAGMHGEVRHLVEHAHLGKVMPAFETVEEALG